MSTPDSVVIDQRFSPGDRYVDGTDLTRDALGRWKTPWGLWVLSDQHLTAEANDGWLYQPAPGAWRLRNCSCGHSRSQHLMWDYGAPQPCRHPSGCACDDLEVGQVSVPFTFVDFPYVAEAEQ